MSDIDKDINRCKELIKEEHSNWIGLTNQEAIENVLNEVEQLQEDIKDHEKTSFEFQEENIKLKKDLETWKKIAEKLADEFSYTDNDICSSYHEIGKCKFEKEKDNRKTCIQCIIDWAKREVLKDE